MLILIRSSSFGTLTGKKKVRKEGDDYLLTRSNPGHWVGSVREPQRSELSTDDTRTAR